MQNKLHINEANKYTNLVSFQAFMPQLLTKQSTTTTLTIFALILTIKLGLQYLSKAFSPHHCAQYRLASVQSSSEIASDETNRSLLSQVMYSASINGILF